MEPQKINIELLRKSLLRRKTSARRFRLPFSQEQAVDALTAALQAEVAYRSRQWTCDDNCLKCIRDVARWLSDPQERKTGLMLMGTMGNGKTTFLKAIRSLVDYMHVTDDYKTPLHVIFRTAKQIVRLAQDDPKAFDELALTPILAIDDLGEESVDVMSYGNVINPIIDLLSVRYDKQLSTIITTNAANSRIRWDYGDRIADRLNEMMRVVIFTNKSYRSNN